MKRPIVRYHGAKWRIAPQIIEHFPRHRVYVEPFGGSGAVLLRKRRSYAEVYNDQYKDIVNVFSVMRDAKMAAELQRLCHLTPFARAEFEAPIRRDDPVEWARAVIFRSFAGFGSASASSTDFSTGFRANSHRTGSTPAHDWQGWPACIPGFVERLRGVTIENRPALEVILAHDSEETLYYVDPPYVKATRARPSRDMYEHEMSNAQHEELLRVLTSQVHGMVVLSGYDCDLYNDYLGDWKKVEIKTFADGAQERVEVLWLHTHTHTHTQGTLF
jgi:DNA adenine methylase